MAEWVKNAEVESVRARLCARLSQT